MDYGLKIKGKWHIPTSASREAEVSLFLKTLPSRQEGDKIKLAGNLRRLGLWKKTIQQLLGLHAQNCKSLYGAIS